MAAYASRQLYCWVQDSVQADLAALAGDTEQPEPPQFALNFLWLNKNIAVAVDQLFDKVTTFFGPEPANLRSFKGIFARCVSCTTCTVA